MPVPNFLRRERSVAFGFLCGRSEVLPHFDNYVAIDPGLKDRWGIPSVHISCSWKDEDRKLAAAARRDTEEMVRAAGGVPGMVTDHFHTPFVRGLLRGIEKEWTLSTPGMFVHEVGGARMGSDPAASVVDPHCALWDVDNLYVTDGACWVTSGWQNPTLTEMAITARACDWAVSKATRSDRAV
jgi:choline dehydrogenase-like flavoprotein